MLAVNLIWIKYDTDNSDSLDFDEAKAFMNEVMCSMDENFLLSENRFK